MKNKRVLKTFLILVFAVLMCCAPFVMQNLSSKEKSASASAPKRFDFNKGNQSISLVVDKIITDEANETKFYLYYPSGNGSAKDFFSCYNSNNYSTDYSGSAEEITYSVGSASTSVNANGQFISKLDLTNNIIIAMNQGFVDISASAYFASKDGISSSVAWNPGNDNSESVSMTLYAYDSNSNAQAADNRDSEMRDDYVSAPDTRELLSSKLKGTNANTVELIFESSYTKQSGAAVTSVNYMRVKLPEVSFTTSDTIAPAVPSVAGGSNVWARERVLSLAGSDNESGIYKIEVSKDGGEWETAIDFTENNTNYNTTNSGNYTLTENGSYKFRSVDNVGNISDEVSYNESHIDRVAPSVETENLTGFFASKTFEFNANLLKNDEFSDINTFEYVVSKNGAVVYSNTLENENSFTVDEFGEYVLSLKAHDEAGNIMEEVSYTLYFVDIDIADFYTTNVVSFDANLVNGATYSYKAYKNGTEIASNTLNNGANELTLTEDGKYTLNFKFLAELNGTTYTALDKDVEIDFTIYTVTTSAVNGEISASYSSLRADGERVTFKPNDGYELYTLTVNGEVVESNYDDTYFEFNLDKNYEIVVAFRKTIFVEVNDTYTYNYGSLNLEFTTSIASELVSFKLICIDGAEISLPTTKHINAGTYTLYYSIDTPEFGGRGTKTIEVKPKEIIISDIITEYDYNSAGNILSYTSSEDKDNLAINFYQNGEPVAFVEAGEYEFEFASKSSNFSVSCSGKAVIIPKILNVTNSTQTYDGTAKSLEFTSTMSDIAHIIVEYYMAGELVPAPVNNGIYEAKFYFSPSDEKYLIKTENITLTISKRQIEVSVNSFEKEYDGESFEVSYKVKNMLESEPLEFNLIYNASKNADRYEVLIERVNESELENYEVTYVDGYVLVTKKQLTVIATEGLSKEYAAADPELTYSGVYGLIEGDTFSLTVTREEGEAVGYYNILAKDFESENYELNFIVAKFQITKRLAFVSLISYQKVYGDADPIFDFYRKNTNILPEDEETILNAISREEGEDVGTYKISIDEKLAANYSIISSDATFVIEKRNISVVADEIVTSYGDKKALTYVAENMIMGDTLDGELEREEGEDVGTYLIMLGTLGHKNYNIVSFTGASFVIEQKHIVVSLNNSGKVYGDADDLSFSVSGLVLGDKVTGILTREEGENAGSYKVSASSLSASSNYIIDFEETYYEISKAEIKINILSQTKAFGEADPEFEYLVSGLDKSLVKLEISREEGEGVGTYGFSIISGTISENYVVTELEIGQLTVTKANITPTLADDSKTYSGEEISINPLQIVGINSDEIKYVYYDYNEEMQSLPVSAGEYKVVAIFAGNENYEAFKTNAATLTVERKFIPITITKYEFVYDGQLKTPEFNINIDIDFEPLIVFEDGKVPVEIGIYEFSFNPNNPNYCVDESDAFKSICRLIIVSPFSSSNGNASVSTGSPSFTGSKLELVENKDSGIKSMFSSSVEGRKCLSVYSFRNIAGFENSKEVLSVSIKAVRGNKNVQLYIMDKNGTVTPVSYELVDGYYVLSVNDVNASIIISAVDNTAFYSKVIIFIMVLSFTYIMTKSIRRRKNKSFFSRNTTVSTLTEKDFKDNENIVEANFVKGEVQNPNTFIS